MSKGRSPGMSSFLFVFVFFGGREGLFDILLWCVHDYQKYFALFIIYPV